MQWILTCENGKQIDMSRFIIEQMEGKITREEVEEKEYHFITTLIKK